jgi:hypothetical protein
LVQSGKIDVAQLLDIDGPSILLLCEVCSRRVREKTTHLIGLVVILRVVLENLRFLCVVKVANEIVEPKLLPPFLTLHEPIEGC